MPLSIRRAYAAGQAVAYAIERADTGLFFDFTAKQFAPANDNSKAPLVEGGGGAAKFLRGAYANADPATKAGHLATPAADFPPGTRYFLYTIDQTNSDLASSVERWVARAGADGESELVPEGVAGSANYSINVPQDLKIQGTLDLGAGVVTVPARQTTNDAPAWGA